MIFQHLVVGFFLPGDVLYGFAAIKAEEYCIKNRGLAAPVHAADKSDVPFSALAYKLNLVEPFIYSEVIELD